MEYRNVEFEVWNRKDLFQFYIQRMRIVMSLTVEMDVTPLVTFAKRQGMKFYPPDDLGRVQGGQCPR